MKSLLVLILFPLTALAAPWNNDCVTFWGSAIPLEERTQENCPTGRSHWDAVVDSNHKGSDPQLNYGNPVSINAPVSNTANSRSGPYMAQTIITTNGNYVVVPNYSSGGVSAILRVSRGK